jgi:hypothetical protein
VEVSLDGERSSNWPDLLDTMRRSPTPARRSEASPKRSSLTPIRSMSPTTSRSTKDAVAALDRADQRFASGVLGSASRHVDTRPARGDAPSDQQRIRAVRGAPTSPPGIGLRWGSA